MRRRSNTDRAKLIQKADALWRQVIRKEFENKCAVWGWQWRCAGYPNRLEAHHIIRRAAVSTRWHPLNGILLSPQMHEWAHAHHPEFIEWLGVAYPARYEFAISPHPPQKVYTHEITQTILQLKDMLT